MKLTPQTYQKMAEQASPPTKSWITIPSAFLIGGGICTLGDPPPAPGSPGFRRKALYPYAIRHSTSSMLSWGCSA